MSKLFVAFGGNNLVADVAKKTLEFVGVDYGQPHRECGRHKHNPSDLGLTVGRKQIGDDVRRVIEGYAEACFFECRPGPDWPDGTPYTVLDHHEEHTGHPPTFTQLLATLELHGEQRQREAQTKEENHAARTFAIALSTIRNSLERWITLVALNDVGYIPAMRTVGATDAEVQQVRREERRAFGVTDAHEQDTDRGISEAVREGPLTIVEVNHNRFSSVTDKLFGSYDQLLIFTSDPDNPEINFFGDGLVCARLFEAFSGRGGGSGFGRKGKEGYWEGFSTDRETILTTIRAGLAEVRDTSAHPIPPVS